MIENNFYLTHRTVRHSNPKMLRTLYRLQSYVQDPSRNPHAHRNGRSVKYEIPDSITNGFSLLGEDADLCAGAAEGGEIGGDRITGDDIGVN
jgi:hypothetical protein